ncbi:AaceriAGL011Cp [[Ashbya] aceris (nom. inval.)]|nr:AaceriAGL011Cp [[Ashbya] aceris (nom. inval.)]
MASPIFVSRRPTSLNFEEGAMGLGIALTSSTRCHQFLTAEERTLALKAAGASVGLHLLFRALSLAVGDLGSVCNVGVLVACLTECALTSQLDILFWASLHKLSAQRKPSVVQLGVPPSRLQRRRRRLEALARFVQTHLHKAALLLVLYPMSGHWGRALVCLWSYIQLQSLLGQQLAAAATALLALASLRLSILWHINCVCHMWTLELCIRLFLAPYFGGVHFTKGEQDIWIQTRLGVLHGFVLLIYILIARFPYLSAPVFYIAHACVAVLIERVTDPLPENDTVGSKDMSRWTATQVLWVDERELVDTARANAGLPE